MTYIREVWHDLLMAWHAAKTNWMRARWLRRYGNPDYCPW